MKVLSESILLEDADQIEYIIEPDKDIKIGLIIDLRNKSKKVNIKLVAEKPNSQASIRILSRLKHSHLELTGELIVRKGAIGSRLYLSHATVVEDALSSVISIPKLTILQDQVQCGHGATVAAFDPQAVEYLETRGMTRQDAESMLYSSLYRTICEWVLTK